jgi:hypothetical protein
MPMYFLKFGVMIFEEKLTSFYQYFLGKPRQSRDSKLSNFKGKECTNNYH